MDRWAIGDGAMERCKTMDSHWIPIGFSFDSQSILIGIQLDLHWIPKRHARKMLSEYVKVCLSVSTLHIPIVTKRDEAMKALKQLGIYNASCKFQRICSGIPLDLHWMPIGCALNSHWMCVGCALDPQWIYIGFAMGLHWICIGQQDQQQQQQQ